jgi:hypothetical protein
MDKRSSGADPFSLGDPTTTHGILEAAGFGDVGFEDVQEPVFYGPNVETALAIVRSMRFVTDVLATLNSAAATAVRTRLRSSLAAHLTDRGVEFDSRAWLVTAVSKHLAVLEEAGLISRRKQGREVLYQVDAARLDQATRAMAEIASQWDRRLDTIKRLAESAHAQTKSQES